MWLTSSLRGMLRPIATQHANITSMKQVDKADKPEDDLGPQCMMSGSYRTTLDAGRTGQGLSETPYASIRHLHSELLRRNFEAWC